MITQQIDSLYSRFKEKAEAVSAQVYRVETMNDANELLTSLLKELNAKKIVISRSGLVHAGKVDEVLSDHGFAVHTANLRLECPGADVGISELEIAIAETGSLAQDASNVDSRLVSSLPLIHIALVPAHGLVATLEDAFHALYNQGRVPGYISFITGPSRTSDIERVLTIGVHGPEKLIILFVEQGGQG